MIGAAGRAEAERRFPELRPPTEPNTEQAEYNQRRAEDELAEHNVRKLMRDPAIEAELKRRRLADS